MACSAAATTWVAMARACDDGSAPPTVAVGASVTPTTAGGTGAYYSVRNNLLLVRLHAPARGRWKIQWRVIDRHLRSGLRALRRREPHSFRGVLLILRGVTDYLMKRHGPLK